MKGYLQSCRWSARSSSTSSPGGLGVLALHAGPLPHERHQQAERARDAARRARPQALGIQTRTASSKLHDDHRPAHLHAVRGRLARAAGTSGTRSSSACTSTSTSCSTIEEGWPTRVSYLADRAARARWEAEAYRSNLELQFWRTGTTPSAQRTASVLRTTAAATGHRGSRPSRSHSRRSA